MLSALAIAKLWCHELGEQILANGEDARKAIDPGQTRELRILHLEFRWISHCISTHIDQLASFQAHLSPLQLSPVVESGSQ